MNENEDEASTGTVKTSLLIRGGALVATGSLLVDD